jgi:hypothetical protein
MRRVLRPADESLSSTSEVRPASGERFSAVSTGTVTRRSRTTSRC